MLSWTFSSHQGVFHRAGRVYLALYGIQSKFDNTTMSADANNGVIFGGEIIYHTVDNDLSVMCSAWLNTK